MIKNIKNKISIALVTLCTATLPVHAEPGTTTGTIVNNLWKEIYTVIKEIGTPLATATLAASAFYFFIIGKDKSSLDKAKGLMIGSGAGLAIIYVAPKIIDAIIKIVSAV